MYHENCRQVHFNRVKRETIRLWREGKSAEDIALELNIEVDKVQRWVK